MQQAITNRYKVQAYCVLILGFQWEKLEVWQPEQRNVQPKKADSISQYCIVNHTKKDNNWTTLLSNWAKYCTYDTQARKNVK